MAEDRRANDLQFKADLIESLQTSFQQTQQFHADEIKEAIHEHRRGDHHTYIEKMIEKDKKRQDLIDGVKKQTIGWGALLMVTAIGTAVYEYVIKHLSQGS